MKFLKLRINQDVFKFDTLEFTNDLLLTDDSKLRLTEYLNSLVEIIDVKSDKEFISIISEQLNIDNKINIGNTIDIHTTNKRIYQMCYLETNIFGKKGETGETGETGDAGAGDAGAVEAGAVEAGAVEAGAVEAGAVEAGAVEAGAGDAGALEEVNKVKEGEEVNKVKEGEEVEVNPNLNFLATICNIKRKPINGDVFIFGNSLLTTQITDPSKTLEYITQVDITIDDLIDVILSNYYFTGVCFEGSTFNKYLFNNNLKIVAPLTFKDITLSELSFKRTDILNFTIDLFYDNTGSNAKSKYNSSIGLFYDIVLNNRIFIALKSETEKSYDSLFSEYISKLISIYNKFLFDDKELMIPKELKFYDYQSNDKYTNKYIIFDNLFNKII